MECFLPSEIARMVLGYLKDEGCAKAYKDFLVESTHLHEYTIFLQRGLEYPTKIGGKGLVDMLEDYGRIKLYELHKQPEVIHGLWCQLEQAMSQLKYVLSESLSPEFRTKGTILNSVMKSYTSQKMAYTRSVLALKKQKPVRSNTSRKCYSEKLIAGSISDDQRASTSAVSPKKNTDWALSQPGSPDGRWKNPAFSPRSPAEKRHDTVAPSESTSPDMPSIVGRKCDSASRQKLPLKKRSDSVSCGAKSVTKLSNVECLRKQREALIQGMRTGIVQDAHRKQNNGRSSSRSPNTRGLGVTEQEHTDVKTVGSSDLLVSPSLDSRNEENGIDKQKSCEVLLSGVDDYCEHVVAMETRTEMDIHEDAPHDLEMNPETAPPEGDCHPHSPLKTPIKRLLEEENSRDAFRSPRRKSHAPKRRSISGPTGTDREVAGETVVPPVSTVLPVDQHSSDSCDNIFSMPVLDELINSRLFAERLAENINRVKLSAELTPTDKPHPSATCTSTGATTTSVSTTTLVQQDVKIHTKTSSPAENPIKMVEKTKAVESVTTGCNEMVSSQQAREGSVEEDPSMSDAAVSGIIALTQNDPDFDAIFTNLFGIDFSGTDIMDEMTSPSASTVLSTNQNAADAILQNDMVVKHDFSPFDAGCSIEPMKGKPKECSSTQTTNTPFVMNQHASFVEHKDVSDPISNTVQQQDGIEHANMSQNLCEMKAPKQSLVPGSFVQIYHVSEDGSTGYYETVQVVSSGDDAVIKIDGLLTNSGDRQSDGQGDGQGDNNVVDHAVNSVASIDVMKQCGVTGSKDSASLTTTDTSSSPGQSSGETYALPIGIRVSNNGEKLQSTSQNATAPMSMNHVSETEKILSHVEDGKNPTCERTATKDVGVLEVVHDHTDEHMVPHTPPINKQRSGTLPLTETDEGKGKYLFTTIDSDALEALHNYDSASPSPAKATSKPQTRKTTASRNRTGIQNRTVRTLGSKTRTGENQPVAKAVQILNLNKPQQIKRQPCAVSDRDITKGSGRPASTNTCPTAIGSSLALAKQVTTNLVAVSCVKKAPSFRSTVLSREMWQAKIHDGHWTLVNERKEKRRYLGVPNKHSSQTDETVATETPAVMTTASHWRCLSQNGVVTSKSGGEQQIGGNSVGTFSATQGAAVGSSTNSECNRNHANGFHIENGETTVRFSQITAGEKHKMPLSFGDAIPHTGVVSDIGQLPLEMKGVCETMSKVASNTAAIKVTCAVGKDRSWMADINTVLDMISPKAMGAVTNQIIDNDVTQVAWAVSPGASSHVRALNFDLTMPRSCITNADSGDRPGNTLTLHTTNTSVSQQTLSPQQRKAIQMLSNGTSPNLAVNVSKSCDHLPSPSIAVSMCSRLLPKPSPETESFKNITSKTCILNNSATKPTTVSVCTKEGATNIKPRDVCRRPARRVAMKTIKRADEILAERSLAGNATQVAPSTGYNSSGNIGKQTDKCVVGKASKTDAAVKLLASSDNSAAPYKSTSPVRSSCVRGALPNGFTTVCESEVAEALVAFATSVVITPVKNTPDVNYAHPSKSASCDTDRHVDTVIAPKWSTPLGQPPPLSSAASPVSVQCKPLLSTASPVSVQCKPLLLTASPVSVQCKPLSSTASPVSVKCKHLSSTVSPVQCKPLSPVSVQCKPLSSTASPVSVECKPLSSTASPVSVQCKPLSSTASSVSSLSSTVSPVSVQCKENVSATTSAQRTAGPGCVNGDVPLSTCVRGVNRDVIQLSSCVGGVSGDVIPQSPCTMLKQGKRMIDIEDQHSVKPKRMRLKKRQKSLANMDVDKFLSKLHAK